MQAVIGPIVGELRTQDLVERRHLLLPEVHQVATRFQYPYTRDFNRLMDVLTNDECRNQQVINRILHEVSEGHRVLCLTERVAHCETLCQLLRTANPSLTAEVLTGKSSKCRRSATLSALRDGSTQVLFATKLADEGLDIPALDVVALASGGRSANRVAQQIGRAMRVAEGKRRAIILDFTDWESPVLAAQAKARYFQVYRPMGARVIREGAVSV